MISGVLGISAYRALWGARTVSWVGDFISLTTVVLYLQGAGAGPAKVAVALAARAVPQIAGPVAGALADRVDARRLMIGCDVGRLLLVGLVAVTLPPFLLFIAVMAATSLLSTLFLPAGKSVVPRIVDTARLGSANALLGVSQNLGIAIGPAVGAELYAHAGPRAAFAVDALSYAVSALVLTGLPRLRPATANAGVIRFTLRAASRNIATDTLSGLAYVLRDRVVRTLTIALFLGVGLAAMDNVALVFLLRRNLHTAPDSVGLASTLYGTAMILAPLLLLRTRNTAMTGFFVAGLATSGLGLLLVGVASTADVSIACYALAGVGNGLENVSCDTLIGRSVPQELLGRVFGAVYGPVFLAETAAAGIGGALLTVLSPRGTFAVAGCGLLAIAGTVGMALLRTSSNPAQATNIT
jgi:MFS family permease